MRPTLLRLALCTGLFLLAAPAAQAEALAVQPSTLELSLLSTTGATCEGRLRWIPADSEEDSFESSGPCWAPVVKAGTSAGRYEIPVMPGAWVEVDLATKEATPGGSSQEPIWPEAVALRLRPSVREGAKVQLQRWEESWSLCPVMKRRARCAVPASTEIDLRLEVPGFVPLYRWSLEVGRATVAELGTWTLQKGSSLAGWLRAPVARPTAVGGALSEPRSPQRWQPRLRPIA